MNYLIIGTGGVGGCIAAFLALTGEDVAKITDIAVSETGLSASGVKIMAAN